MDDISNELRKIARDYWDDLQAHVDEKAVAKAMQDTPEVGFGEAQELIDSGKLEVLYYDDNGKAVMIPRGPAGKKVLQMLFEHAEKHSQ